MRDSAGVGGLAEAAGFPERRFSGERTQKRLGAREVDERGSRRLVRWLGDLMTAPSMMTPSSRRGALGGSSTGRVYRLRSGFLYFCVFCD